MMRLEEVCELIADCPHSTAKDEGEGFPLIRTPNIGKGRLLLDSVQRVSESVYNKRNARAVPQDDDLVFAREAPAGNVAIIKNGEKVCLGQRTVLLRPNKKLVNPDFLTYFLLAPEQQYGLLGTANGATVSHVNIPTIRELKINLPPLQVQNRIAGFITAYDDLIENNQKQIKLLEEAAQRLYKEWFVDLRFPGHETTPIVNGVPEGWHEGTIQDVVIYHDKKRKPLSGMQRAEMQGEYRYYGAASILDYVNDYLFDGTYLLLGEDGTVVTEDGFPVLQYVTGKFWVNNHAHVLTGQLGYPTEYLYMMFKSTKVKDVVTGAAQPKISQARLSNKKIIVPSKQLVSAYCDITGPMFKEIINLEHQITVLKEARDRLLPKLMSGEIEV